MYEVTERKSVDFEVQGDFVKKLPEILSNVKEIKAWALQQTETDRELVLVSEDDFETAKKRCAEINKIIESIDGKRKDVKRAYMKPYETFETALKDVKTVLECAKNNLWGQVKEAEQAAKQRKKNELHIYYDATASAEVKAHRGFEHIFKSAWLNSGTTFAKAKSEIDEAIKATEETITVIKSLESENEPYLLKLFAEGKTLTEIMSVNNALRTKKAPSEPQKQDGRGNTYPQFENATEKEIDGFECETSTEPTYTITFRVKTSKKKLELLKKFLVDEEIEFERG